MASWVPSSLTTSCLFTQKAMNKTIVHLLQLFTSTLALSSLSETVMTMTPKIKLTYFDIEGVAEPVRLAFALANIDYEDERIAFDQWKDMKPKMPFGQLPVLTIDDGHMQTQSMAMLRWVGAQSKALYPTADPAAMYKVDEALGVVEDFKYSWTPCLSLGRSPQTYGHPASLAGTDEAKALTKQIRELWMQESFPMFAKNLEKLLSAHNGQWLASNDSPTIADCVAVVFLRSFTKGHIDYVPTTLLDSHPALVDYVKRFCALVPGRYTDGLHE